MSYYDDDKKPELKRDMWGDEYNPNDSGGGFVASVIIVCIGLLMWESYTRSQVPELPPSRLHSNGSSGINVLLNYKGHTLPAAYDVESYPDDKWYKMIDAMEKDPEFRKLAANALFNDKNKYTYSDLVRHSVLFSAAPSIAVYDTPNEGNVKNFIEALRELKTNNKQRKRSDLAPQHTIIGAKFAEISKPNDINITFSIAR
jgi:hypothetical protein